MILINDMPVAYFKYSNTRRWKLLFYNNHRWSCEWTDTPAKV